MWGFRRKHPRGPSRAEKINAALALVANGTLTDWERPLPSQLALRLQIRLRSQDGILMSFDEACRHILRWQRQQRRAA